MQSHGDRTDGLTSHHTAGDLFAFGQRQRPIGPLAHCGVNAAGLRENLAHRRMVSIEQPGNLVQ